MECIPLTPIFLLLLGDTLDTAIWSTVEEGLAITAGSLATLRPLLRIIAYRFGWSTPSSYAHPLSGQNPDRGPASRLTAGSRGASELLGLSPVQKKSSYGWEREVPPGSDMTGEDQYGCVVSVKAERNAAPTDPNNIVVHHSQTVHRTFYASESEERLAQTEDGNSR